ncbi:MAG: DnaJ domain-containing protein [Bdellovibrionales bacterium]|nr:DnaJ domain-containing protein [Bdellovibrionales bacterium]
MQSQESAQVRFYRDVLGVGPNPTSEELKRSYRRLALAYHPDHNASETARAEFDKIRLAFETLSDPKQVQALNRSERRQKFSRTIVGDLKINFGTFFGYRRVSSSHFPSQFRLLESRSLPSVYSAHPSRNEDHYEFDFEENQSILDHAAYDLIEVTFAGKLSSEDEESLVQEKFNLQGFGNLPWVFLNNQGVLDFFDGKFLRAHRAYSELIRRVPNNIVFLYRLAVCEIVLAFEQPKRNWLGISGPNKNRLKRAQKILAHAIKIGAERSIGKQRCEVPKKLLADVYELLGHHRVSKRLWREILKENKQSVEATYQVHGEPAARVLANKIKTKPNRDLTSSEVLALPDRDRKSRR